jgi:hypothetical protein
MIHRLLALAVALAASPPCLGQEPTVRTGDDFVEVETDALVARILPVRPITSCGPW